MSHRYEFVTDVDGDRLLLPEEIVARIRARGIRRVRVVMSSVAADEELLAARGIDAETIDRVATAQSIDRDIATVVLSTEGSAGDELAVRLRNILPP